MKVRFWIQSSRGTDHSEIVEVESLDGIKYKLEDWADTFGAMHVSENCVSYGYDEGEEGCQKHLEWAVAKAAQRGLNKFLADRQQEVFQIGKELKEAKDYIKELEAAREFEQR